jgi:hypothetical protein
MMVSTAPISRSEIATRSSKAALRARWAALSQLANVLSATFLSGAERGIVHQAVGGEYGVNDQPGLRPELADVEQTQVGDGGDLLEHGEPVPGEHGVDPGPA